MKYLVVLFNIGCPSKQEDVFGYLFKFFLDKRIFRIPFFFRFFFAFFIALIKKRRSQYKYKIANAYSLLLKNTQKQAVAIKNELQSALGDNVEVLTCMKNSSPGTDELLKNINSLNPSNIILLPLFPQFSTATTMSSFDDWNCVAKKIRKKTPNEITVNKICCFYDLVGLVSFYSKKLKESCEKMSEICKYRVLFSAHGLPESFIGKEEPYIDHLHKCVNAIVEKSNIDDWVLCYQSAAKFGKWTSPFTEFEIARAGAESMGVIIVPISFVSENLETVFDIDIQLKNIAHNSGVKHFDRIMTPGDDPCFIRSISNKIIDTLNCDKYDLKLCNNCCYKKLNNISEHL